MDNLFKRGFSRFCVLIFLFLLFFAEVYSEEWDSFADEGVENAEPLNEPELISSTTILSESNNSNESDATTRFTNDFYIALGAAVFGFLILVLLIYLFFRKPKNNWEKTAEVVKEGVG